MPQKVKIKKLIQKIITTIALAAIIAAIGNMYNNNAYAQTDNSGSGGASTDNSGSSGTTSTDNSGGGSTDNSGSGSGTTSTDNSAHQLIMAVMHQRQQQIIVNQQQNKLRQISPSNPIHAILRVMLLGRQLVNLRVVS